jgi:hypothetical protein
MAAGAHLQVQLQTRDKGLAAAVVVRKDDNATEPRVLVHRLGTAQRLDGVPSRAHRQGPSLPMHTQTDLSVLLCRRLAGAARGRGLRSQNGCQCVSAASVCSPPTQRCWVRARAPSFPASCDQRGVRVS